MKFASLISALSSWVELPFQIWHGEIFNICIKTKYIILPPPHLSTPSHLSFPYFLPFSLIFPPHFPLFHTFSERKKVKCKKKLYVNKSKDQIKNINCNIWHAMDLGSNRWKSVKISLLKFCFHLAKPEYTDLMYLISGYLHWYQLIKNSSKIQSGLEFPPSFFSLYLHQNSSIST